MNPAQVARIRRALFVGILLVTLLVSQSTMSSRAQAVVTFNSPMPAPVDEKIRHVKGKT